MTEQQDKPAITNQPLTVVKKPAANSLHMLLAFALALGVVFLLLDGGWSLGFFLTVLLTEVVFLAWIILSFPDSDRPGYAEARKTALPIQFFLAVVIIDLGLCMYLYSDNAVKVLNILVLLVLFPVQYLLAARVFRQDWDKPTFWLEAVVSIIVRPFVRLPAFGNTFICMFRKPSKDSENSGKDGRAAGKIVLGLLLAVPFLLIVGSLLSSADAVFASLFDSLWSNLSVNELISKIVVALILLPFIFSFLYSGRSRETISDQTSLSAYADRSQIKDLRIDKTILITFLSCINLLYICFAVIQVAYLTNAFNAILPADLTYAEYARSGFFELAGVTVINLALILLTVKGADRHGPAGVALRVESLILLAGSLVQWASAMFRMKMYIDIYGLTLLRFWVTAFMLMILVFFVLMLMKEFRDNLPLFKCFTAVALISLLALNNVNGDAWIARHNVGLYEKTGEIDAAHFRGLSSDAVPAMLELTISDNKEVEAEMAKQLLDRYYSSLDSQIEKHWQSLNLSDEIARQLIMDQLERLSALNPACFSYNQP